MQKSLDGNQSFSTRGKTGTMHRAAIQCGSQVCAKRVTPCGEVAAESAPAHFCVRKGKRLVSQTHRKDSARFLASDSHPQTTTHHTPAGHHLLSNQAPLTSPERPCVRQHPLPRPGYQRATAQQTASSIHAAPTHQWPPFESRPFGAALGAWLPPLSQLLLLLLLLALDLLEEALLFFKSLQSFNPLLDGSEMPVKRKEGS